MELTQEKLKTGIKNQMQNFLEGVYLTWRYDPYAPGVGDMRMQDDARTPGINPYGAKYVMRPVSPPIAELVIFIKMSLLKYFIINNYTKNEEIVLFSPRVIADPIFVLCSRAIWIVHIALIEDVIVSAVKSYG